MNILSDILRWIFHNFFSDRIAVSKFNTVIFLIAFLALLAACGPDEITPTPVNIFTQLALTKATLPTTTITPTALPTVPPLSIPTYSVIPTQTPEVTPLVNKPFVNAWKTQFALETPVRTPVTPVKNEKLSKVFVEGGNLYFQNNSSQSIQLANSEKDRDPILSDDGKKIVFYRGEAGDNLYLINSDGSQEKAILTNEIPLLIGKGEIKSPTFVSSTHLLLFNTYLCMRSKGLYDYPDCTIGVYSLNTDTGKINIVVENISGNSMRDSNFEISPDGKYVSVAGEGHINIYHLSSGQFKVAYPNVLTYYITPNDEYLPKQYWFPNSSGLIIISAADNEYNEPAGPPWIYVAFNYIIGEREATQIPFDNHIILFVWGDDWSVSPDRKWILFTSNETDDRRDSGLIYLGNLTDGNTQAYSNLEWPLSWYKWSPDSRYFAHTNAIGFIGSVDGFPVPVGGHFMEWIDSAHYYYTVTDQTTNLTETYIGKIDSK